MKIALAQINMQLGDIEGICRRVSDQIELAAEAGVRLLCVPAPLISGTAPGQLVHAVDFEHDLLAGFDGLAKQAAEGGVICLIPAAVAYGDSSLFEIFMLKDGRVIPMRTTIAQQRAAVGASRDHLWTTPVFDVDGVRIAATLDAARDIETLPPGCDLVLYFQIDPFNIDARDTAAVAGVIEGSLRESVRKKAVWLAHMAPLGAFDEAAYLGGSYVMDDSGLVLAAAPLFEEALLIQEIRRGMDTAALGDHELPSYNRETFLWQAGVLSVRDAAVAHGCGSVVVLIDGGLPSVAVAALCVDALGPRNVVGLMLARGGSPTAALEAAEQERATSIRRFCERVHIRLIEREGADAPRVFDRDAPSDASAPVERMLENVYMDDLTRSLGALGVSSATKTDYALGAAGLARGYAGDIAPFGDIYLTQLEFMARERNRVSPVIPDQLTRLSEIDRCMRDLVTRAVSDLNVDSAYTENMMKVFAELSADDIDSALEAHIDRNEPFERIDLAGKDARALTLLLMLVREGGASRRRLPMAPIVSARSFVERAWPSQLAWFDGVQTDGAQLSVADLAREAVEREKELGGEEGDRIRGELMGILGGLLGIPPEQMQELDSEEGQRRMRADLDKFQDQMQDAIKRLMTQGGEGRPTGQGPLGADGPKGFSLFSLN